MDHTLVAYMNFLHNVVLRRVAVTYDIQYARYSQIRAWLHIEI
jgi:hypothetical protein